MTVKYLVWQRQQQKICWIVLKIELFLYTLLRCPSPWILASFSLFLFSSFSFLFKIVLFQNKFRRKRKNKYYNLERDRVAKWLARSTLNGMRRFLVQKHFFCFNCVSKPKAVTNFLLKQLVINWNSLLNSYRKNGMQIHLINASLSME